MPISVMLYVNCMPCSITFFHVSAFNTNIRPTLSYSFWFGIRKLSEVVLSKNACHRITCLSQCSTRLAHWRVYLKIVEFRRCLIVNSLHTRKLFVNNIETCQWMNQLLEWTLSRICNMAITVLGLKFWDTLRSATLIANFCRSQKTRLSSAVFQRYVEWTLSADVSMSTFGTAVSHVQWCDKPTVACGTW